MPNKETVYSFLRLYKSMGYTKCGDETFENGYEKIAIYALNSKVTHAARQLSNGNWTSKIGGNIDIEHHTIQALEGPFYGEVVRYLKHPVSWFFNHLQIRKPADSVLPNSAKQNIRNTLVNQRTLNNTSLLANLPKAKPSQY